MSFATNVGRWGPQLTGGADFALAVGEAARTYSKQSYLDQGITPGNQLKYDWPPEMVQWQTTRYYVARPLVSNWATAP
jgi:hypothetical protein